MGNGTRHILGAIAGIVAIPVVFALVFGGLSLTMRAYSQYAAGFTQLYVAVAILAAGAVVLALLVGTRLSPLASLIPGLAFAAVGGLAVVSPRTLPGFAEPLRAVRVSLGGGLRGSVGDAVINPAYTGAYLLVGVVLVVASIAPSRWRAKIRPAAAPGAHRASAAAEEPWPPAPPVPSDPAQHRATPPLPSEETQTAHEFPYGSGPQAPYGSQTSYGSGPQTPYGSGPQPPYGGPGAWGGASGDVAGYAPGDAPSSWSGPQTPYNPDPRRPAQPAGEDPYASPPSAFSQPSQPWGPPPGDEQVPRTRAFSAESEEAAQNDRTPRTMPDANANDETYRIPWSETDQARFRDRPDR